MKERLIGAAVLVALAVWLIPWVLDGPGPTAGADAERLELPAAQNAGAERTQTIRLDENRDSPLPAARNPTPAAPSPPPQPSARTVEPVAQPAAPLAEPQPQPPAPLAESEPQPPAPLAEPAPLDPSRGTQVTEAEPLADGGGDWMVQIGSFGREDNARRLADRAAAAGFAARVSTFVAGNGPMFRVRVGPQPTRERAADVASSLRTHGFVAQVVGRD